MKRGRNQRRRPGGSNPNRALDSNGPEVRIRGTANQIYDKYTALARDASSSGDRIKAESYLQHAEHYFRMIRSMQPAQQQQSQSEGEGDQPSIDNSDDSNKGRRSSEREPRNNASRNRDESAGEAKQPAAEAEAANAESAAPSAQQANDEEAEKKPKRRRPRRTAKAAAEDSDAPAKSDDKAAATAAE